MGTVVVAIGVLGGLGVIFAIGLAVAARAFHVETDPRIEQVYEVLPHVDCGACGAAGCQGYAEAVVQGGAPPNLCKPGGPDTARAIASLMGIEAGDTTHEVAVLKCKGCEVGLRTDYAGERTCTAAALVQGGPKACEFGCIGYGDCAAVCPVNAIAMKADWPVVNEDLCIACGACVRVCPKGLFELRPLDMHIHVRCASHSSGAAMRKICSVGCIACRKCEKVCGEDAIHVIDNVAVIDYTKCSNCGDCVDACPKGVIDDLRDQRGLMVDKPEECAAAEA